MFKSKPFTTKDIVIIGLLSAITFLFTAVLPIPVGPTAGGLSHLGNVPVFVAAFVFGSRHAAFSGAIGMALFDLSSGAYAIWAPYTFIIRLVMGYIVGGISQKKNGTHLAYNLAGFLLSSIWMMVGYYFAEVILYGNWIAPFTSIVGNITQLVIGIAIALPVTLFVKKYYKVSLK
jgi:uncharacterized membrane protein